MVTIFAPLYDLLKFHSPLCGRRFAESKEITRWGNRDKAQWGKMGP
ncbi:hypothetical protein [Burkholderia sp. USMB20]|nr:hypothetical protein [Burkholderia sp. USMB20]